MSVAVRLGLLVACAGPLLSGCDNNPNGPSARPAIAAAARDRATATPDAKTPRKAARSTGQALELMPEK